MVEAIPLHQLQKVLYDVDTGHYFSLEKRSYATLIKTVELLLDF
jgi:hypothetical protein